MSQEHIHIIKSRHAHFLEFSHVNNWKYYLVQYRCLQEQAPARNVETNGSHSACLTGRGEQGSLPPGHQRFCPSIQVWPPVSGFPEDHSPELLIYAGEGAASFVIVLEEAYPSHLDVGRETFSIILDVL